MMLLFSDMLYMLVSPSGPMCLRCMMLTLGLLCLLCFIAAWTYIVVSAILVVCSKFVVCFMFDCLGEVFVECVCYLCG